MFDRNRLRVKRCSFFYLRLLESIFLYGISKVSFSIPLKSKSVKKMSPFSLWYLVLQIDFLKCYGTSLILLKNQLQYSTEMEKRKEN